MARRISMNRANWFDTNRKALIQRYITERNNQLFWSAWLDREFDLYRNS